jgi:hypothetical protein
MYKLKQTEPPFEIVDGPFAGRKYDRKGVYAEIPPDYKDKFSEQEAVSSEQLFTAHGSQLTEEESHE